MIKSVGLMAMVFSWILAEVKAEDIYIATDLPAPSSAEEVVPMHPFFTEPSTGNEVFEEVEALKRRVEKLEEQVKKLEAR